MKIKDLVEEQAQSSAQAALQKILHQVGIDYNGECSFRYSDCEQQHLTDEFKLAKSTGLIRFKAPVDWYEPTSPPRK